MLLGFGFYIVTGVQSASAKYRHLRRGFALVQMEVRRSVPCASLGAVVEEVARSAGLRARAQVHGEHLLLEL